MIRLLPLLLLSALAAAPTGCGGAEAGAAVEPPSVSLENAGAYARAKRRLGAAKLALADGRDTSIDCRAVLDLVRPLAVERDAGVVAFAADATQTCGFDAPYAWARANVAKAQGPAASGACAHAGGALGDLARAGFGADARVEAIGAVFRQRCGA